jgi:hypothetical protein
MTEKKIIIFLYNRLFDPLIQSNFWLYINDMLTNPGCSHQLHLITYEDDKHPITKEQRDLIENWKEMGLAWTPLTWHSGQGMMSKARDIISGFFAVMKLRFAGYKRIVTLASVAGTFGYLYSVVLRLRLFLYQFEPHSEYAIDNNMWPKSSLQYKMSHYLERKAAGYGKVIASGTRFMEQRLKDEWKVDAEFVKIPTVANQDKFIFSESDRREVRAALNITDEQWVLFYPGKFGDLYYRQETAFMFKWLHEIEPRLHFLIVTPHTDEEVIALFEKAGVDPKDYTIRHSSYEYIHRYFSAADFAIIAVPPGPSKKFISNIKVGEYLCAGLPYLITRGVSEDYLFAEDRKVGVVVDDFKEDFIKKAWPEIRYYLEMDATVRRAHCRKMGLEYRGFDHLNRQFQLAISKLIS